MQSNVVAQQKPDLVYLWVDGSDPVWRTKRHHQAQIHEQSLGWSYANVEGRFRDNDELKYSLRALTPFLHHFGRIHLVTDNQRPKWLNNHPMINMVSHEQLRQTRQPTYSSRCLEASLHHITGLADRFLYLNDDVFLGGGFSLDRFFQGTDRQYIHFEKTEDADKPDEPPVSAADVSRQLLTRAAPQYSHDPRPFAHAPRGVYTNAMKDLEAILPGAFAKARQDVFRRPETPSTLADLYPRWMQAMGRADHDTAPHQLISSGRPDLEDQLRHWKNQWQDQVFFCINDTLDNAPDDHPSLLLLRQTLSEVYPNKSLFEK